MTSASWHFLAVWEVLAGEFESLKSYALDGMEMDVLTTLMKQILSSFTSQFCGPELCGAYLG